MHCPFCAHPDTKVIDSRLVADGEQIRRRRECISCGERFTTFESAELVMPRIIKQSGTREPFDENKLLSGIQRALEKRPVSIEDIDAAMTRIKQSCAPQASVKYRRTLGEWVMDELRQLDEVAYVRFASVYRSFKDLDEFRAEIERVSSARQTPMNHEYYMAHALRLARLFCTAPAPIRVWAACWLKMAK